MTERQIKLKDARIIPLRLIGRPTMRSSDAGALFRTGTRTLRPIEALLLAPVFIPVTVIVLLLLLAWFILWLATVGLLVVANLVGDASRAMVWLSGAMLRSLDRRPVGFQGHSS
jgi:hypothetical protein